jgi:DNA-binding FadR family transcriptional regulator
LTTLVQSGHLISLRGRGGGTFVTDRPPLAEADFTPLGAEAWAVLDLRVAVELGATLLAAERAEPDQLDRLDLVVEKMSEPSDFDVYRRADIRFHIGVAEAARSPRLVSAMTEVQSQMSDLITRIAHPPEVLLHSNDQHRALVRLLRRGDGLEAVRLMREHMEGTEHILAGLI